MYNNPYVYNNYFPYQYRTDLGLQKKGLISSIFPTSKINWTNILNNTQKTLNVINQAIPVYYQVKPIYNNAKTMFRMVNALKENDKDIKKETSNLNHQTSQKKNTDSLPVFFL